MPKEIWTPFIALSMKMKTEIQKILPILIKMKTEIHKTPLKSTVMKNIFKNLRSC